MPMLDAFIPDGALEPEAEQQLLGQLTDILLKWEGADPAHPIARSIAWVFLHRPAAVYVAGEPANEPRYRIIASVPEGQLNSERRAGMVAAVTEAVLDAEPVGRTRDANRVWVFTNQVPEGTWGGAGKIFRLADIIGKVLGDEEQGRVLAKERLADVKAERDAVFT